MPQTADFVRDSVRRPCGFRLERSWDRIYGWQRITDPNLWTDAFLPMDQQLLEQVLHGFTMIHSKDCQFV